jgi:Asp/Glu/hydantoin racemase
MLPRKIHHSSLAAAVGRIQVGMMPQILVINPNSSQACGDAIAEALDPLRFAGGPEFKVVTLADGPPGIYSWRDWHAAVDPLCRAVEQTEADAYVIACASDPGFEAVRAVTQRPVLGVFRCAVAAALLRADRFGVVALADASKERHLLALRALGVEARLAAETAMNVPIETLLDPQAARARLIETARALVGAGAGAVILGCTGMAGHRAAIEAACGVPVIEPCQAAAAQAIGMVAVGPASPGVPDGRSARAEYRGEPLDPARPLHHELTRDVFAFFERTF